MKNKLFKDYFQTSTDEVKVNASLKRSLAQHMFKKPIKQSIWSRYKALLALPAGAALAIGIFINLRPLPPQEALAQALENIFNIESFDTTFGMPNDGKLHYKVIDKKFLSYGLNNTGSTETEPKQNNALKMEFWSDGENVRQDSYVYKEQGEGGFSTLANVNKDIFCQHGEEFSVTLLHHCESLSVYEKQNMNSMIGERSFVPQFKEAILGDFNEFKLEPYEVQNAAQDLPQVFRDNWYTLSFSTIEPLPVNANQVWKGSRLLAWDEGGVMSDLYPLVEFKDPSFYNHFENGKYWHKYLFQRSDNTIYFQFNTTKKAIELEGVNFDFTKDEIKESSMLYKLDLKEGYITPVKENEINSELNFPQAYSVLGLIKEDLVTSTLRPAYYMMKNLDIYKEPLSVETMEKNGQHFIALKYLLRNSPEVDPTIFLTGKNYIYFYMDSSQTNFLGYSMQTEKGTELQSVWIEDKVLPQQDKEKIFAKEEWSKAWAK